MPRTIIGGIVAAAILVITAVAYFMTTSSLEQRIGKDVRLRVSRAEQQLIQNASLEGLKLLKQVEALAADPAFAKAMGVEGKDRSAAANLAFRRFIQSLDQGEPKPDIMALTDATGDLVVLLDVDNPLPKAWKQGEELKYPALGLALSQRTSASEVWDYEKEGLMKVGVAPLIDPESGVTTGAVVIAYAMSARNAQEQQAILGADVVYFHGERIYATSFTRGAGEEDTKLQSQLTAALGKSDLGKSALTEQAGRTLIDVTIGGGSYVVTAARMPRFTSKPLPAGYAPPQTGAMVMMSLPAAMAPLRIVRTSILLLGVAAFVLAVLAVVITAKRILHQADEIEDGINDIVNGNLERSIRPVGAELDGLAHALNVMLARLLGRPEPGEEAYDEHGNLIQNAPVNFDNEDLSPADAAALSLAQEPEPAYYNRIYNEYIQARQQVGESIAGISYENFVTKLRFNESNLRSTYQCSAVRFRVVVKDDKVTLKPVPIV